MNTLPAHLSIGVLLQKNKYSSNELKCIRRYLLICNFYLYNIQFGGLYSLNLAIAAKVLVSKIGRTGGHIRLRCIFL